jgi:hypothetical protein
MGALGVEHERARGRVIVLNDAPDPMVAAFIQVLLRFFAGPQIRRPMAVWDSARVVLETTS